MNHLVNLPAKFPERIGVAVVIISSKLLLVQNNEDVPVGICPFITTSTRPKKIYCSPLGYLIFCYMFNSSQYIIFTHTILIAFIFLAAKIRNISRTAKLFAGKVIGEGVWPSRWILV